MNGIYPRNEPRWVEAESVKASVPDATYVDVTVYDEMFRMCHVEWSNPFPDKSKSDVLVQNRRGDWLRVWFFDKSIIPYSKKAK